jgi:hypothetical protein
MKLLIIFLFLPLGLMAQTMDGVFKWMDHLVVRGRCQSITLSDSGSASFDTLPSLGHAQPIADTLNTGKALIVFYTLKTAGNGARGQTRLDPPYNTTISGNTAYGPIAMDLAIMPSDSALLHQATDSFLVFRCRMKCAAKNHPDSVLFYGRAADLYQRAAREHYLAWDKNAFNKKRKTNLRFMNPDKYFKCPCQ